MPPLKTMPVGGLATLNWPPGFLASVHLYFVSNTLGTGPGATAALTGIKYLQKMNE